jgi:hypothetical protein
MYLSDPKTQAVLKKDNYLYHESLLINTLKDQDCKQATERARKKEGEAMPQCWKKFTGELDRLYQTRQNVILVEEILSAGQYFDIPAFQQATTKWQVIIVINYASFGAGYRVIRISMKSTHSKKTFQTSPRAPIPCHGCAIDFEQVPLPTSARP